MDLKTATLFAGIATLLNIVGLVVNYGSLFMLRSFQPTIPFLVLMFTSILTDIGLTIFFFSFFSKQN